MLGFNAHAKTIQIILPVGISFYTFQTLSYTIDIYRRHLRPTNDLVAFGAFVSFFPQLVAGPIERASHLLPQMLSPRAFNFESARTGLGLIIWGLFKKVVIADSFAPLVDSIFGDIQGASAITLFFGALMFAFQIYGDFSGYSDMAIGIAALFGFKLMTNFNKPYLALNIQDFWRRWHISLTTWFKDYLYIPLGGSRGNKTKVLRNVFIVFLVSGFWHGANFTFIAWGFLHFLFYLPSLLRSNSKMISESGLRKTFMAAKTFILVVLAWVFFRASSISEAFDYLKGILALKDGYSFIQTNTHLVLLTKGFIGVSIMYCYEYFTLKSRRLYNFIHFFVFIFLLIFLGSFKNPISFIYFQF
jgi:D-alanyl-lipoteichoic acid acyltransferase DltB (MBOAT superfamily)